MSTYINQLRQLQRNDFQPILSLREKLITWYRNLPEISRYRPFSMKEIEAAVESQGRYISIILLDLGWQRKRKWSTQGRYMRYWLPPTMNENLKLRWNKKFV